MGSNQTEAPRVAGPPQVIEIPLRKRSGEVQAYALVDAEDAVKVTGFRWYVSGNGYAVRMESIEGKKQRTVSMARVILGLDFGDRREADHISRDKLDNRRCNIRITDHAGNCQNRRRFDGTSTYRGVSLRKDRKSRPWQAYACLNGKQHHLGFFDKEEEAAEASAAFRREHMPYAAH